MKKLSLIVLCFVLLTSFAIGGNLYKGKHQRSDQQTNETIVLPQVDVNKEITKDPTSLSPKPPEEIENCEAWWTWYSYCQSRIHHYFSGLLNLDW